MTDLFLVTLLEMWRFCFKIELKRQKSFRDVGVLVFGLETAPEWTPLKSSEMGVIAGLHSEEKKRPFEHGRAGRLVTSYQPYRHPLRLPIDTTVAPAAAGRNFRPTRPSVPPPPGAAKGTMMHGQKN